MTVPKKINTFSGHLISMNSGTCERLSMSLFYKPFFELEALLLKIAISLQKVLDFSSVVFTNATYYCMQIIKYGFRNFIYLQTNCCCSAKFFSLFVIMI